MAMRTDKELIEDLKKQNPVVFMGGERVESVVDHPILRTGLNMIVKPCQFACDENNQPLTVVKSPYSNDDISRWVHIPDSKEDILSMVEMMRESNTCGSVCTLKHTSYEILSAVLSVTHMTDEKYGTEYHQRAQEYVKFVHTEDPFIAGSVTDGKGDRRLRPAEQKSNPDAYIRVVEKRKDGIVVRGAKPHCTAAPYANELFVCPITMMQEDEKDYSVSFFTPVDADGIKIIVRPPDSPMKKMEYEYPLSGEFGTVEAVVVFDDVFVPWERVMMCGEYEFSGLLPLKVLEQHGPAKLACMSAHMDLKIGAAALVAEYNGTDGAPHIEDKITEMIAGVETTYACAIASAVKGYTDEIGIYYPAASPAFAGRLYGTKREMEDLYNLLYISGGLAGTMVQEADYLNPETRPYLDKYYQGAEGTTAEERIRAFNLLRDLTTSEYAGWHHTSVVCGMGMPKTYMDFTRKFFDLERVKQNARSSSGISVSKVSVNAITRSS